MNLSRALIPVIVKDCSTPCWDSCLFTTNPSHALAMCVLHKQPQIRYRAPMQGSDCFVALNPPPPPPPLELQEQHIVNVMRIHVPEEDWQWAEELCSGTEVEVFSYEASSVASRAPVLQRSSSSSSAVSYKYFVVMPMADRNLSDAITHERLGAGEDWHLVMSISQELGHALSHLHTKNIIHGDFKPVNAVRTGERWRLIDLDTSCKVRPPPPPPPSCINPKRINAALPDVQITMTSPVFTPSEERFLWQQEAGQRILPTRDGKVSTAVR